MNLTTAWVYILTNKTKTTLYIGVTTAITTRIWEHRMKQNSKSFSVRYRLTELVYFEEFETLVEAIEREKYLKGKRRSFKDELISAKNPTWRDVSSLIGL